MAERDHVANFYLPHEYPAVAFGAINVDTIPALQRQFVFVCEVERMNAKTIVNLSLGVGRYVRICACMNSSEQGACLLCVDTA